MPQQFEFAPRTLTGRIIFLSESIVKIYVEYAFHMCLSGRKVFEVKILVSIGWLLVFPSEETLTRNGNQALEAGFFLNSQLLGAHWYQYIPVINTSDRITQVCYFCSTTAKSVTAAFPLAAVTPTRWSPCCYKGVCVLLLNYIFIAQVSVWCSRAPLYTEGLSSVTASSFELVCALIACLFSFLSLCSLIAHFFPAYRKDTEISSRWQTEKF